MGWVQKVSGICIIAGTKDASDRLRLMLDAMAQFGQKTECITPAAGLACGRAWHGRLASEHPPRVADDGLVILVDGEIFDNNGPIHHPEDLIQKFYREKRLDVIAHLNGSFSVIIYDPQTEKTVLASDRLGSRPLFVWRRGKEFTIASRLDAVLADDRVPRRISRQGIIELVALQRTVAGRTSLADVETTTASEIWHICMKHASRQSTRRLSWERIQTSEAELTERLAEGIRLSVKRRTADHVRHGLLLSGGLDARAILAAAAEVQQPLSCLTSATFRNLEVEIAESLAERTNNKFCFYESRPEKILDHLDAATSASDGLFAAPCNLFGHFPEMAKDHDVLLSGHGLDYTVRGYYLPCRSIEIAGSITRLPALRPIANDSPDTILSNMRVGIDEAVVKRVLNERIRPELAERKKGAITAAINHADIKNPYDAWDAYILSSLGRHYAYSDFVAIESVIAHRCIAFDPDVFDVYLAMPPSWRAAGRIAQRAMIKLSEDLMSVPDANTGFKASMPFPLQIVCVLARAVLRRMKLVQRPVLSNPMLTNGSWANYGEVFRRDMTARQVLEGLEYNQALMDTGMFSRQGIAGVVSEHLSGARSHTKLLFQLITMSSWLSQHSYEGVSVDG